MKLRKVVMSLTVLLVVVLSSVTSVYAESNVIATSTDDIQRINVTVTKYITPSNYQLFVSDNNVLNEAVTINYYSVPNGSPVQDIYIKVTSSSGSTILYDTMLGLSDQVTFYIPWDGGTYSVYAKGTASGSVTLHISD
jgi:hypothetical protein